MTLNICIDLSDELNDCSVGHQEAIDLINTIEALFSKHELMHEFRLEDTEGNSSSSWRI